MTPGVAFLSGFLTFGYAVAALFFLRFWRESRERLFAYFAAAFLLLASQRVLVSFVAPSDVFFVVRLAAFIVILFAVYDRNRRS